jgi:hypothetical protein
VNAEIIGQSLYIDAGQSLGHRGRYERHAAPVDADLVQYDPPKVIGPSHAFHPHGVMSALACGLSI